MSETKLLPCPFCGGEAEWTTRKKQWIRCKNCGVESTFCEKTEEAIEAWNTRKPMERIMERLEKIKMRYFLTIGNTGSANLDSVYEEVGDCIDRAIEIVKEGGGLSE